MISLEDGTVYDENGRKIGTYLLTDNTLKSIEVYTEYEGNGYGSQIIDTLCDQLTDQYAALYVACVSNPALEHILQKRGGEIIESYQLPIAGHGLLDGEYPDYKLDFD